MSNYATLPDARKAAIKAAVQANRDRLKAMPPLEQAAYKIRKTRTDADASPYTEDEKARADAIMAAIAKIEAEAQALGEAVRSRLQASQDREDQALLEAFGSMKRTRIDLPLF